VGQCSACRKPKFAHGKHHLKLRRQSTWHKLMERCSDRIGAQGAEEASWGEWRGVKLLRQFGKPSPGAHTSPFSAFLFASLACL
jgi:hypothetical protein